MRACLESRVRQECMPLSLVGASVAVPEVNFGNPTEASLSDNAVAALDISMASCAALNDSALGLPPPMLAKTLELLIPGAGMMSQESS